MTVGAQVVDLVEALKKSFEKPTPAEIPLLLKGPLVRQFLAGRKTVTRRLDLKKWQKAKPGDLIWFKENWRVDGWDDDWRIRPEYQADRVIGPWLEIPDVDLNARVVMRSVDDAQRAFPDVPQEGAFPPWEPGEGPCKWVPSIHMPKVVARCWAEIVSIRVERLHEITEKDAISEGATVRFDVDPHEEPFREAFASLWDSINKKPGARWADNPMVARIEFRRIER